MEGYLSGFDEGCYRRRNESEESILVMNCVLLVLVFGLIECDLINHLISTSKLIHSRNVLVLCQWIFSFLKVVVAAHNHLVRCPPDMLDDEVFACRLLREELGQIYESMFDCLFKLVSLLILFDFTLVALRLFALRLRISSICILSYLNTIVCLSLVLVTSTTPFFVIIALLLLLLSCLLGSLLALLFPTFSFFLFLIGLSLCSSFFLRCINRNSTSTWAIAASPELSITQQKTTVLVTDEDLLNEDGELFDDGV